MKFEILEYLPAYGPMYVSVSDDGINDYSEGFVVKFYKSDGTNWIANFKQGWTNFSHVQEFTNSDWIVVIANGTCYIINPEEEKPKSVFGVGFSSILVKSNGGIILEDTCNFTIIEPNAEYWHTASIAYNGFAELKINDDIISGLASEFTMDDDLWVDFSFNLNTLEIKGGGQTLRIDNQKKGTAKGSKKETNPWWKIW
jgi:hypothetical protein